jgi:DNA-3-methyladenine glycosylase I
MLEPCPWCGNDPLYRAYHDLEWGVPQRDARRLWEGLILEGFQAGLSWITILRKREGFRRAFAGFDPQVIAGWGEAQVLHLLADPGIVRHRGKIEATIANARAFLEIEAAQGFSPFVWGFVADRPIQTDLRRMDDARANSPESEKLSKSLKRKGFRFCGPITVYAFMQAQGLVNDHLVTCPRHAAVAALGRA